MIGRTHEISARISIATLAILTSLRIAEAGPAVNQFSIEDLDIEQGEIEIELQSDWSSGFPRRKFVEEGGEIEFDDNEIARQRYALELAFGLANWLSIGTSLEWEEERVDDPASFAEANQFEDPILTEVGLEATVVLVPVEDNGIGLGAFAELQMPRGQEARTLYIGPIVQAENGPWSATGNFAFVKFMGGTPEEGELRDEKWDFSYSTQLKYSISHSWAIAAEAYGTIDRIGDSGTRSDAAREIGDQDVHRAGPVVYYSFNRSGETISANADDDNGADADDDDDGTGFTLSAGLLFGLNENTPDTTIKSGIEIEF